MSVQLVIKIDRRLTSCTDFYFIRFLLMKIPAAVAVLVLLAAAEAVAAVNIIVINKLE